MTQYQDVRPDLKTGDIVLFSGRSFVSRIIKRATRSPYSHVGMVLKFHGYSPVFVWESTKVGPASQGGKRGVQINLLSNRISNYNGRCAIRHLKGVEIAPEQLKELDKLRHKLNGRPYESDYRELIKSAYDGFGGDNTEDLSHIFCSELVAEAWQSLCLIDGRTQSNEYLPCDFSEGKEDIPFVGSVLLGDEIHIE